MCPVLAPRMLQRDRATDLFCAAGVVFFNINTGLSAAPLFLMETDFWLS